MVDICPECKSDNFEYKKKGPHVGQHCKNCGIWIKWIPKEQINNISLRDYNKDGQIMGIGGLHKIFEKDEQIKVEYIDTDNIQFDPFVKVIFNARSLPDCIQIGDYKFKPRPYPDPIELKEPSPYDGDYDDNPPWNEEE